MNPLSRLGVLAAVALAGCASLQKVPEAPPPPQPVAAAPEPAPAPPPPTVVVRRVPVRVSCVPRTFPRAPRYPDSDAALRAADGAADRYQLMAAGRLLRERRLAELERAIEACRRAAP
jgi:hypothetical protein